MTFLASDSVIVVKGFLSHKLFSQKRIRSKFFEVERFLSRFQAGYVQAVSADRIQLDLEPQDALQWSAGKSLGHSGQRDLVSSVVLYRLVVRDRCLNGHRRR